MTLLAESAGRLLEYTGNCAPRGMTVHDRTRLIGRLPHEQFQQRIQMDTKKGQITLPLFFLQPLDYLIVTD